MMVTRRLQCDLELTLGLTNLGFSLNNGTNAWERCELAIVVPVALKDQWVVQLLAAAQHVGAALRRWGCHDGCV